jgi:hypothetical protein
MTRAHCLLLLCGLLSVGAYGGAFAARYSLYPLAHRGAIPDLGQLTGYSQFGCWLYVGAITVLFGLYGAAIKLAGDLQGRPALLIALGCGLAAALVLVQVYPYAASDVFLYIVRGRVLGIHGRNSLVVPPSAFSMAPYLPFDSEWADTPSPYGPLWEWTAAGLARLGDGSLLRSLLAFKALGLLSYIGCSLVLVALLRSRDASALRGLVMFAWNPLVLVEGHAMAHSDLYMLFFVLLALWFWAQARYPWVIVSLVAGGLVKYVPLILLPPVLALMWRRLGWRAWLRATLVGALVSVALALILAFRLWPGTAALGVFGQMERLHNSVTAWLIVVISMFPHPAAAFEWGHWLMRILFVLAYLAIIIGALRRDPVPAQVCHGVLYAWLCLAASGFGYWYIAWLVGLCPLVPSREARLRTLIFGWSGLLSVAMYTYGHASDVKLIYLVTVPFVFGFPLLAAHALNRWLARRARGTPKRGQGISSCPSIC